jgi:hypothetical protein
MLMLIGQDVLEQKWFWHDLMSFDDNNSINIQYGTLIIYSKCADIYVKISYALMSTWEALKRISKDISEDGSSKFWR